MTRRRLQAFTIIEMLVIISIIVLLVAILVPALGAARKSAQKSVCISNLQSVGQAMGTYVGNTRDKTFPGSFNGGPPTNYDLFGGVGSSTSTPINQRPLNAYLGNAVEVAQCPLDLGADTGEDKAWIAHGSSYIYFDGPAPPAAPTYKSGVWVLEGRRMSEIKWPSRKMAVADLIISGPMAAANQQADLRYAWHNGVDPLQLSMLFVDGHAKQQTRKVGGEATASPGANPEQLLNSSKDYY